jgi:hypothetical protein
VSIETPTLSAREFSAAAELDRALAHHRSGEVAEAERIYRRILEVDPKYSHAHNNLGLLALQDRRPADGIPLLRQALDMNPTHSYCWMSLVFGLMQTGELQTARTMLAEAARRGIRSEPLDDLGSRIDGILAGPAVYRENWMPGLLGDPYTWVLKRMHAALCPKTYLEIGVETGRTLALARCASIGIDPQFIFQELPLVRQVVDKPSLLLYQIPSDHFFGCYDPCVLLDGPIDFAFLDGMHRCEYLLRDFLNTERYCRPDSVIALHDCLPVETPMAERVDEPVPLDPKRKGMAPGDVWRTVLLLQRRRPDLRIKVLDAGTTGLVVITNLDPQNRELAGDHAAFIEEMLGWSLEEMTLGGYYEQVGVEPEIRFRTPEQIQSWVHSGG